MVNYNDVLDALEANRLAGFGTDVFETEPFPLQHPFLTHQRVICTPHIAGVTEISYRNMARCLAENVMRVVSNTEPIGVVNNASTVRW